MKRLNITVPNETYHLLITRVGRGKISAFLAELAEQKLKNKNIYLAQCYREDSMDEETKKDLEDWSVTDLEGWQ